ncbi:MAG: hypothetical protein ACI82O_004275, partial [Patiriisocius sp.]
MMGTAVKGESLAPDLSLSDHFYEMKFTFSAIGWVFNTNNELLNLQLRLDLHRSLIKSCKSKSPCGFLSPT